MGDIFKKRLKQLREKKGVTQKDVADAIGATAQSIIAYEKGERIPNIDKAAKIARYFGVSLDWLCGLLDDTANATNRQIVHMLRVIAEKTGHTVSKIEGFKHSKDVEKYFADLEKMKGLLANGDIDQELFDLWEEKKNSEEWLDETFETEGEDDGEGEA